MAYPVLFDCPVQAFGLAKGFFAEQTEHPSRLIQTRIQAPTHDLHPYPSFDRHFSELNFPHQLRIDVSDLACCTREPRPLECPPKRYDIDRKDSSKGIRQGDGDGGGKCLGKRGRIDDS